MRRVPTVLCLTLAAAGLLVHAQEKKDDQQRPPTFRTGAHFVAVDAYPTQDGKALTGLTINDFELLEDGKPQVIDRVEFIEHPEWTPLAERRDPNSQREGFEMAADPKYRVFVLYLDAWHVDFAGGHRVALPIIDLLNRMMGPQDLFGVMTPYLYIKDLMLGQSTLSIQEQLEKYPYWGIASKNPLPEELELDAAGYGYVIPIRRLDKVYADLEALVDRLGVLRDERKNIIFFSDTLPSPQSKFRNIASDSDPRKGAPPEIRTGPTGKLTMGSVEAHEADDRAMKAEKDRLIAIDFDQRFKDLLRAVAPGQCLVLHGPPRRARRGVEPDARGHVEPRHAGRTDRRHFAHGQQRSADRHGEDCRRPVVALRARLLHEQHPLGRRRPETDGQVEVDGQSHQGAA